MYHNYLFSLGWATSSATSTRCCLGSLIMMQKHYHKKQMKIKYIVKYPQVIILHSFNYLYSRVHSVMKFMIRIIATTSHSCHSCQQHNNSSFPPRERWLIVVVMYVLGLSLSSSIYSTWSVPVLMNLSILLQLVNGEAFRAIHGLSV